MIILRKVRRQLLIFVEDNVIIYNFVRKNQKTMKIPVPPVEPNLTKSLEEVLKPENRRITSVCASQDAELVAVTLQNRQLVIYDSNFDVVSNVLTKRAVSKVRFTKQDDVLVADKTGDVYLYKKQVLEPELLLGHLSMLLDIVISECGKFVITSDRDEKIRVSSYPNCYNIVSYCLGHREFVTNLEVCGNVLISASGDGTLRFWSYSSGKQLFVVNTNDYVADRGAVDKFCKDMDGENVDVNALPVVDMGVFQDIVAVAILGFKGVQLYRVDMPDVRFMHNVMVDSEVVAFNLGLELFVLTDSELVVFELKDDAYEKANSEEVGDFYESYKSLLCGSVGANVISALYKRKYDNVQEYMDKKKLRLESKS